MGARQRRGVAIGHVVGPRGVEIGNWRIKQCGRRLLRADEGGRQQAHALHSHQATDAAYRCQVCYPTTASRLCTQPRCAASATSTAAHGQSAHARVVDAAGRPSTPHPTHYKIHMFSVGSLRYEGCGFDSTMSTSASSDTAIAEPRMRKLRRPVISPKTKTPQSAPMMPGPVVTTAAGG